MEIKSSVFYFAGCGSERMFPEISMAAIALLFNSGIRVVIPPEYLCCGYPLLANGRTLQADIKSYENRVILHRMANIVSYMEIKNVLVSCGTCHEMLSKYSLGNIFHNAALLDTSEFIAKEKLYKEQKESNLLYHEPCHSPLKSIGSEKIFNLLLNTKPISIDNCCGESGTMALSTPEISNLLQKRKKENINNKVATNRKIEILTTCPSCVQGLSRITGNVSVTGKHLLVHLAELHLGASWKKDFLKQAKNHKGIEKIIL